PLALAEDPPEDVHGHPLAEAVLAEINGRHLTGGKAGPPLAAFGEMRDDGTTDGGCWTYAGVFADGINQARRRTPGQVQDETAAERGWAWPADRRILYYCASSDPHGRPGSQGTKWVASAVR